MWSSTGTQDLGSLIEAAPARMIDAILLVSWRIWYAHYELTHDKALPS
jgi:hypothetical protein